MIAAATDPGRPAGVGLPISPPAEILGRAALVHDWLLGMRGGEWVLDALLEVLPGAHIHTLFYRPNRLRASINRHPIHPASISRLPGVEHYYRWLLPWLPAAIEAQTIAADRRIVIATSHCVAHGIVAPPGALHINYYFSPMRYLYDQQAVYQARGGLGALGLRLAAPRLRSWDLCAARRAHRHWAISHFVARRVEQAYGVCPRVIYPPVRTRRFVPPEHPRRVDEYLLVSAMVPYKRIDLAIRAANRNGLPLRVVGGGPLLQAMRRLAGPSVRVVGAVDEKQLIELYQTRRALIYPAEEDFGLVPLEAMACGMPVLALGTGGVLETLAPGRCGEFFATPTVEALSDAIKRFHPESYDPANIRAHAETFGEDRFAADILLALAEALAER